MLDLDKLVCRQTTWALSLNRRRLASSEKTHRGGRSPVCHRWLACPPGDDLARFQVRLDELASDRQPNRPRPRRRDGVATVVSRCPHCGSAGHLLRSSPPSGSAFRYAPRYARAPRPGYPPHRRHGRFARRPLSHTESRSGRGSRAPGSIGRLGRRVTAEPPPPTEIRPAPRNPCSWPQMRLAKEAREAGPSPALRYVADRLL